MATRLAESRSDGEAERKSVDAVVIRFAGDSGDGMQLTGTQFTQSTALMGNDLATFPDFPAEIRAPIGTTYGVSAFQINFASYDIMTPGDAPDVLVAMNPAALKVHLRDVPKGGTIVLNTDAFTDRNIAKAGFGANPLEDGTLDNYVTIEIAVQKMTLAAVAGIGVTNKEALRCKNMWALGLMCWMYDRDRQPTVDWIDQRFGQRAPEIAKANIAALNAGHAYGETAELPSGIPAYIVPKADVQPGVYRAVTGTEAVAWGLLTGAQKAGLPLFFGSYPITPASSLLHALSNLKQYGVTTFQAEDEIAAVCSAIGASFAGSIGVTSSSGPGVALKTEGITLAFAAELPLVIVNSQRGGPSTGLPTKTEQSDLYQAVYGRNADSPLPVVASCTAGDCFFAAIEAVRLAVTYMTPCDPADRRLSRQRGRAVGDSGRRRDPRVQGRLRQRERRLPSLPARREDPGAQLGGAGHAGADAPDRRNREELRHGPHLLRPGQSPPHDQGAGGQGRRHRRGHPLAAGRQRAVEGPARGGSDGARPSARSTRRSNGRSPPGSTWPISTSAMSGRCRAISASCWRATRRYWSPR